MKNCILDLFLRDVKHDGYGCHQSKLSIGVAAVALEDFQPKMNSYEFVKIKYE